MNIISDDEVYVFDEIGWGDTAFSKLDVMKTLLVENLHSIQRIEFFNTEKVICFRIEDKGIQLDHWFHDIDADILDFMCQKREFRVAVRRFFIKSGLPAFSVDKYPLLAATILGNNNED